MKFLLSFSLLFVYFISFAQPWVWKNGIYYPMDIRFPQYANYGTIGVEANTNTPGTRSGSVIWLDNKNNLWLFGGTNSFQYPIDSRFSSKYNPNINNDIWKYNINKSLWTWINGSNSLNTNGVYGAIGYESPYSKTGARTNSLYWSDSIGNVWIFGGYGLTDLATPTWGVLSDLWKYNIANNKYTFLSGNSNLNYKGNYGIPGVPVASNIPSGRCNSATWKDSKGNLWMFGGGTYNTTNNNTNDNLGDLWEYDINSNYWIYVRGFQNQLNVEGIYHNFVSYPIASQPGCRQGSSSWTGKDGNLYLFGGAASSDYLNDLWQYNPSTNAWKFINGDSVYGVAGKYGTVSVENSTNKPGARTNALSWTDSIGNFWLFGGYGYCSVQSSSAIGYLNDLWKYNPKSNKWTWVSGSIFYNQFGNYGSLGISNINNSPGSRFFTASSSHNYTSQNSVWIFGGIGYANTGAESQLGDLWYLKLNSINLPLNFIDLVISNKEGNLCLSWTTSNEINTNNIIIYKSLDGSNFTKIDSVKSKGNFINNYHIIDYNYYGGLNYYRLESVDKDGSITCSKVVSINNSTKQSFFINPNPAKDYANIHFIKTLDNATIAVYDIKGKQVITQSINVSTNSYKLNTQSLKSGLYVIKVNTSTGSYNEKLLINK